MQSKRDYYQVLDIRKCASDQEIKTAYRKLAMQFHPDRNPDNPAAEEKFKEATEAYEILIDWKLRMSYDCFGADIDDCGSGFEYSPFNAEQNHLAKQMHDLTIAPGVLDGEYVQSPTGFRNDLRTAADLNDVNPLCPTRIIVHLGNGQSETIDLHDLISEG